MTSQCRAAIQPRNRTLITEYQLSCFKTSQRIIHYALQVSVSASASASKLVSSVNSVNETTTYLKSEKPRPASDKYSSDVKTFKG